MRDGGNGEAPTGEPGLPPSAVEDEPKEPPEAVAGPTPAEPPKDQPEQEFDFSQIDPEKEWGCFGTIDIDNDECDDCPFRQQCADKAGIKL